MFTVQLIYPGKVFLYQCHTLEAAEFLVAQFKNAEWVDARIL